MLNIINPTFYRASRTSSKMVETTGPRRRKEREGEDAAKKEKTGEEKAKPFQAALWIRTKFAGLYLVFQKVLDPVLYVQMYGTYF
jgi:hypothetical protein